MIWVEVSQDGGVNWTQVYSTYYVSSTWTQTKVDLTPYKAKPILVRFRLYGYWGGGDGWYIDDVAIYDTTAPVLTLSTLQDKTSTSNEVFNITGKISASNTIKSLTINGADVALQSNGVFSYAMLLKPGMNLITSVATDAAGIQTTDSRTITFDSSLPKFAITDPADNATSRLASIRFKGTADAALSLAWRINGGSVQPMGIAEGLFDATIPLLSGLNTIEVTATDGSGRSNTLKRSIWYDPSLLAMAINIPVQDSIAYYPVNLSGVVAGGVEPYALTITMDGQSFTPVVTNGTFQQQLTFSIEKTYSILAAVIDGAGVKTTVQRNIIYRQPQPGDCDINWKITIDEVQYAINMYLGLMSSSACVDLNNDGKVSIDEVQKVVNGYLGL